MGCFGTSVSFSSSGNFLGSACPRNHDENMRLTNNKDVAHSIVSRKIFDLRKCVKSCFFRVFFSSIILFIFYIVFRGRSENFESVEDTILWALLEYLDK